MKTILVTGANGFIGSHLVENLEQNGFSVIQICGDHGVPLTTASYNKNHFIKMIKSYSLARNSVLSTTKDEFISLFKIDAVVHLGACTDTRCEDWSYLVENNLNYSKDLYNFCSNLGVPFIYASSAATYGASETFDDDNEKVNYLYPINKYGWSKHLFDLDLINQDPIGRSRFVGLKFFNVYGKNEKHKKNMSSMIYQGIDQIKNNGFLELFEYGHQQRDFIFVEDVVNIINFMLKKDVYGIFNVGSGVANSFNDMANCIFESLNISTPFRKIKFKQMPNNLKDKYQIYTCANIDNLRKTGYTDSITTLSEGVQKVVLQLSGAKE